MTLRLQWTPDSHGEPRIFPIRGGKATIVFDEAFHSLEPFAGSPPEESSSFTAQGPDDQGKFLLEATGRLKFGVEDRWSTKVRVLAGGVVRIEIDELTGVLTLDGKVQKRDQRIGEELGGYQLLGALGKGAVGTVYRAMQLNLNREVALKVLNASAAKSPVAVASFKREAQAAGRLHHPNLVQVFDVGQDEGTYFYAMELVGGGNLEEVLAEGPIHWSQALPWIRDAAMALSFADDHGLVHRDVKPENLMLTPSGEVKLADLGLAVTRGMLAQESAGGTPHFLAPECVQGKPNSRSDLYSLGCSMYRLLTGTTPFEGASVREILLAHRDDPIPLLEEAGVDVIPGLQELLDSLMAKEPDDRPSSASEVIEQIDALLAAPTRSRLPWLLIPALGVAFWFFLTPEPEPDPVVGPEPKVVIQKDPAAALLREEAAAAALERDFALARTATDPQQRIADLEAFLLQHPNSPFQERCENFIRAEKAALKEQELAAQQSPEAIRAEKLKKFEASLQAHFIEKEWSVVLNKIQTADSIEAPDKVQLQQKYSELAESDLSNWESQHASSLVKQDWPAAEALRAQFQKAIGSNPPSSDWAARLAELQTKDRAAFELQRLETFQTKCDSFAEEARSQCYTKALLFDFLGASDALSRASSKHGGAQLIQESGVLLAGLEQAQFAWEDILAAFKSQDDFSLIEPISKKRAVIQSISAEGVSLTLRERGANVNRFDPWSVWRKNAAIQGLLEPLLEGEQMANDDVLAFLALQGQLSCASELLSWNGLPDQETAKQFAAHVGAWLTALPPQDDRYLPFYESSRVALSHVHSFGQALAAGDDYLALQQLKLLRAHFSFLSICVSGSGATWGLTL